MRLTQAVHFLARKLLYLWIKTDVQHRDLVPDTTTPVIFVPGSRALSDLLVLEAECIGHHLPNPLDHIHHPALRRWRQLYTIASRQPLKDWLTGTPKRSAMLRDILVTLQQHPDLDVLFVPVSLFWGRPVSKQKHWLMVLFADTWGVAGRLRRFFTILFHGKNTLLQFAPPISCRSLIDFERTDDDNIDAVQSALQQRLTAMRTATLGPDVSHRRTLIRSILTLPDVERAIAGHAAEKNMRLDQARRVAHGYLTEIVANCSYITIQLLQRILTAFWNRFYSGIDVFHGKTLRKLALDHEIIYVPCHRSHIDYLLLSYVIHAEGLAIPYIAAGRNLNMPVIGSILRKGGAFFIRRSFRDNPLYSRVLFEYLASLVANGMPVEYFIEGGRSRTGRLLKPRPGMLAMTIRAFLKYRQRPVAFVPVYIGYEKMIEGQAYLAELKGRDKQNETLFGSIRALMKIRGHYGRVSASFGEPVCLDTILDQHANDWRDCRFDDDKRPDWLKPVVNDVAMRIMRQINQSTHVNGIQLLATTLLATGNQAMDETALLNTLQLYQQLLTKLYAGSRVTLCPGQAAAWITEAEKLKLVKRHRHELGDFICLDRPMAILLTYYRNNVLHLFALPALIACCFTNNNTLGREKILARVATLYPFLQDELFLPWPAEALPGLCDEILARLCEAGLLIENEGADIYSRPRLSSLQHSQIHYLGRVIAPVLELYYIIFALLALQSDHRLTRDELEHHCYLMAQRISLIHEINSPDFFDKKLIRHFIDTLIALDYVSINAREQLIISRVAVDKGKQARHLLDKSIQYTILQMLRNIHPSRSTD